MKKEPQIGVRVGLPSCFALELEDVYRHTGGAHRALAFPDFLGLLVGLGLEQYRRQSGAAAGRATGNDGAPDQAEPDGEPDVWDWPGEGLRLVHDTAEEA
jgi:hypothetical protein